MTDKKYRLIIYDVSENLIKNVFEITNEIVDILISDVDGDGIGEILVFSEYDLTYLNLFEISEETGEIEFIRTFAINSDVSLPRKGFVIFGSFTEKYINFCFIFCNLLNLTLYSEKRVRLHLILEKFLNFKTWKIWNLLMALENHWD